MQFLCSLVAFVAAAVSGISENHYDVVVYAATPGGVMSAVAAGREGVRVALVEPGLYIGGMCSGGLGNSDYGANAKNVLGGRVFPSRRGPLRHAICVAGARAVRETPRAVELRASHCGGHLYVNAH